MSVCELGRHVHDGDRRQRPAGDTLGERHARPFPGLTARQSLHRGAGAPENERRAGEPCHAGRHLPRVVARGRRLLVGGLVLLVDHDESQVLERSEQRRSRTDHDPRRAGSHEIPLVVALPRRQSRVKHGDFVAEPGAEAADRLGGQRNLRHQNARRATGGQYVLYRAQVDLGLARSGHAVDHDHRAIRASIRGSDRAQRLLLTGDQTRVTRSRPLANARLALASPSRHAHGPGSFKRLERAVDGPQVRREFGDPDGTRLQGVEYRPLRGRRPAGSMSPPLIGDLGPTVVNGADIRPLERPDDPVLPIVPHGLRSAAGRCEEPQRCRERAGIL